MRKLDADEHWIHPLMKVKKIVGKSIARFSVVATGPMATAGANFLLALALVPNVSAAQFGYFSFVMVLINLFVSVSNAVAATPLSIEWSRTDIDRAATYGMLGTINLILALVCGLAITVAGLLFDSSAEAIVFAALAGIFAIVRWYRRSLEYARQTPKEALTSDSIYAAVILCGLALLKFFDSISLVTVSTILFLAFLISVLKLGTAFRGSPWLRPSVNGYDAIWQRQSRWSSAGVVCTELSTNAHSYVIPALAGPSAYAAVSIAMLWWRPSQTLFTALVLSERPKIASWVNAGNAAASHKASLTFIAQCLTVVALNALAIFCIYEIAPKYFLSADLNQTDVTWVLASFSLVMAVKAIRTPVSVLCQAHGDFRSLAIAGFITAPASVAAVAAVLWLIGTHSAVLGVLVGELLYLALIMHASRERTRT